MRIKRALLRAASTIALVLPAACVEDEAGLDVTKLVEVNPSEAFLEDGSLAPASARVFIDPRTPPSELAVSVERSAELKPPCSEDTTYNGVGVPHQGAICLPTCVPTTIYLAEAVNYKFGCDSSQTWKALGNSFHGPHTTVPVDPSIPPSSSFRAPCGVLTTCQ